MPFKKNYGYWIDNNLVLDDFRKQFAAVAISKENLEEKWKLLLKLLLKTAKNQCSILVAGTFFISKKRYLSRNNSVRFAGTIPGGWTM
jgi:hypothetical protein